MNKYPAWMVLLWFVGAVVGAYLIGWELGWRVGVGAYLLALWVK